MSLDPMYPDYLFDELEYMVEDYELLSMSTTESVMAIAEHLSYYIFMADTVELTDTTMYDMVVLLTTFADRYVNLLSENVNVPSMIIS